MLYSLYPIVKRKQTNKKKALEHISDFYVFLKLIYFLFFIFLVLNPLNVWNEYPGK